ncbi:hypothetical protein BD413DRAFT_433493, partial [Trametes elegans]
FTGCLAHADITTVVETGYVMRIIGYFQHNEECQQAAMVRFPAVPLHPHVVEVAMIQLRSNASVSQLRNRNMEMLAAHAYRDQRVMAPGEGNYRYNLLSTDFRSLYRRHYRENHGIDITIAPEHNVNNWLDSTSRHFKPTIQQAIFNYVARTNENERFRVCISTAEMRTAAWKYCHRRQLILDGTFGLCDSRLLLWIAMGVDENNSGIPVAMFLFSAPTGSKATHAGYDTAVLAELLITWRDWLSEPRPQPGDGPAAGGSSVGNPPNQQVPNACFEPYVAITDTDAKERGALLRAWPSLLLLLCRFHVRQCWTNQRTKSLKGLTSPSRERVEQELRALEESLLNTMQHEDALQVLAASERALTELSVQLAKECAESKQVVGASKTFHEYLQGYWMPVDMWQSWARRGRADAAARMGVGIEKILTTTNHLENFNGQLKGVHI